MWLCSLRVTYNVGTVNVNYAVIRCPCIIYELLSLNIGYLLLTSARLDHGGPERDPNAC